MNWVLCAFICGLIMGGGIGFLLACRYYRLRIRAIEAREWGLSVKLDGR